MLFGILCFGKDNHIGEDKYVPINNHSIFRIVTYSEKQSQPHSISTCKVHSPDPVTSLWGALCSSEKVFVIQKFLVPKEKENCYKNAMS